MNTSYYESFLLSYVNQDIAICGKFKSKSVVNKITFKVNFRSAKVTHWLSTLLAMECAFGYRPEITKTTLASAGLSVKKGIPSGCSFSFCGSSLRNLVNIPTFVVLLSNCRRLDKSSVYGATVTLASVLGDRPLPYDYFKNMPDHFDILVYFNEPLL